MAYDLYRGKIQNVFTDGNSQTEEDGELEILPLLHVIVCIRSDNQLYSL